MPPVPKHSRRWFQFSLGTLFVVVTVAASCLGFLVWQWRIVQSRQEVIKWLESRGGGVIPPEFVNLSSVSPESIPTVPFWRVWMGDEAIYFIVPPRPPETKEERERMLNAFPEARIREANPHGAPIQ